MAATPADPKRPHEGSADTTGKKNQGTGAAKELPKGKKFPDTGEPGGGVGRVDITGVSPEETHVDPNLTEGHPGYEESGDSEIIPPARATPRKT